MTPAVLEIKPAAEVTTAERMTGESREGKKKMLKVIYDLDGLWVVEIMYPAEFRLFRLTKSDYIRVRHIEKI